MLNGSIVQTGSSGAVHTSHPAGTSASWTGGDAPEGQLTEPQEEFEAVEALKVSREGFVGPDTLPGRFLLFFHPHIYQAS